MLLAAMETPVRRLLAFGLDYLVISAYLLILLGLSLAAMASPIRHTYSAVWSNAWSAEVAGLVLLTVPVVLYFALLESSPSGSTLGKRTLRLRVVNVDGTPVGPWSKPLALGSQVPALGARSLHHLALRLRKRGSCQSTRLDSGNAGGCLPPRRGFSRDAIRRWWPSNRLRPNRRFPRARGGRQLLVVVEADASALPRLT